MWVSNEILIKETISTLRSRADSERPLVSAVRSAFTKAVVGEGYLPPFITNLVAYSGQKYRLFINNLIGSLPNSRYLEVGACHGSTLCSALYNNPTTTAVTIDNWTRYMIGEHRLHGASEERLRANVAESGIPNGNVQVISKDF